MKQNYPPCPLLPPSITIKPESGLVKLSGMVMERKCHQIGESLTVSSLIKFKYNKKKKKLNKDLTHHLTTFVRLN